MTDGPHAQPPRRLAGTAAVRVHATPEPAGRLVLVRAADTQPEPQACPHLPPSGCSEISWSESGARRRLGRAGHSAGHKRSTVCQFGHRRHRQARGRLSLLPPVLHLSSDPRRLRLRSATLPPVPPAASRTYRTYETCRNGQHGQDRWTHMSARGSHIVVDQPAVAAPTAASCRRSTPRWLPRSCGP